MDGSRWNSLFACARPCLWSHDHQPEIREFPSSLNADCSNVAIADNVFNLGGDIERIKSCKLPNDTIHQQLAPALDSINGSSYLNLLQRQEAAVTAELRTPLMDMLYSTTPLSGLMQVAHGTEGGATAGASADSLESLDCLLSRNSNTDTSLDDDDGISVLFSDCRNLWNFNSSGTMSSGESENNQRKGDRNATSTKRPTSSKRNREHEEKMTSSHSYFDLFQSGSSITHGGPPLITENPSKHKKPRLMENPQKTTNNINFQQPNSSVSSCVDEPDIEAIAQVKEMIYRAAVFRPVNLDLDVVEKPKRKNVRISSDPQTVAARQRRERISDRIRILQRLVPGGNKMDTASMLDEAANYLKFLRSQVQALESLSHNKPDYVGSTSTSTTLTYPSLPFNPNFSMHPFLPFSKP